MIKKLIEITVLAILIVGLIYLLNQIGTIGAEAKIALKYIWFGIIGIMALAIIAGTLIVLAAIIFGIGWLKGITGRDMNIKSGSGIGSFVKQTVESALKGSFDTIKDIKNLSARNIEISQEYPNKQLKIKNNSGNIKLTGHDGENIIGKIEIMENEEGDGEIYFENGEIKVKTKSGKKAILGDIELSLPKNLISLDIESVNGDISIYNFVTESETTLKGVNGDISVSDFKNSKEILIKTINGDITIKDSHFNSILTQSVSGDIVIRGSQSENAVFKTVSGDIDYRESAIKNPTIKTVSGDIRK